IFGLPHAGSRFPVQFNQCSPPVTQNPRQIPMRRFALASTCGLLLAAFAFAAEPKPDAKLAEKSTRFDVPYRLTETKHVMVRVKINGKGPFNLICDTGAPAVFITKVVAKKAGVESGAKGWANF